MELSKMFGVERDTPFMVDEYTAPFMVRLVGNFERLFVLRFGEYVQAVNINFLQDLINRAPAGIIHLPPPLTDEQREQLKALYTLGYRWLAKDENGATYAYDKQKLAKGLTVWLSQERGCSRIHDGMAEDVIIPLVSWSDPEPFDIGKALGVGE